jgi:site-specific DNA-methyltransferase (adenine-specific)
MVKTKRYRLYLGDCLEIMKNIEDSSIDMVLCDLPYGTTANKWDVVISFKKLWKEYKRIAKDTAVFVFTASQPFSSKLIISNIDMFKHEWIWIKNKGSNFANTVREPFKEHESILVFSKGKWTYNKQMQERTGGGVSRANYAVTFDTKSDNYRKFDAKAPKALTKLRDPSSWQKYNTETGLHPTQKPVALMEYLILTYTNKNETVLDNCMGSGTTGVACINTKRRFIGIEKDKKYYKIAKTRIRAIEKG